MLLELLKKGYGKAMNLNCAEKNSLWSKLGL